MKITCLAGSTSRTSINRTLARYAASRIEGAEVDDLDLKAFEMPLFSVDREREQGIPAQAGAFHARIQAADGIILSLAEHNGSYSTAFKNVLDWVSRLERAVWAGKPMFLLSTSPGKRGGASVLAAAEASFPHLGAQIAARFSLPLFGETYDPDQGILQPDLAALFDEQRRAFQAALG